MNRKSRPYWQLDVRYSFRLPSQNLRSSLLHLLPFLASNPRIVFHMDIVSFGIFSDFSPDDLLPQTKHSANAEEHIRWELQVDSNAEEQTRWELRVAHRILEEEQHQEA